MKIDAPEIVSALQMVFCKDEVFEIRVLNATLNGGYGYTRKEHNESGFFNYGEIDKISGALEVFHSASGVYFTPNPLVPLIYSKCGGRIEDAKKHGSASDKHVLRRRWLLVDCDAHHTMNGIEVSGISSSDEEHQYAIETAYEIADHLKQQLFTDPIILDSGNGCQLMYAIDLPADEKHTALVQYMLKYLSRFDNEHVKVDQSVFNPSRIWRLPGTQNCKGDASADRPHRMARVIQPNPDYETTATEHLERLAAIAYDGEVASSRSQSFQSNTEFYDVKFNLENWIQKFCPDAKPPVPYNGGRKWILPVCPFNSDHDNFGCAAIFETADGRPGFECRHDGCKDNHWKELRTLLDREYRERDAHARSNQGVDIDGILNPQAGISSPDDDEPVFREESNYFIPFPKELYNVPGIVKSVMELTLKYAPEPNRPLALGGALALMSVICSRKVISSTNATPNIYLLLIEDSGNGKNFPRTVNKEILYTIGMDENISDKIASGPGLEDTISNSKALLWQNDEFQYLLADMGIIKKEDNNNSLSQYVLTYYTESNSIVKTRSLAGRPGVLVNRPHLIILGTTTPPEFFDALTERVLRNGLFARMNILVGEGLKVPDLERETSILELPEKLLKEIVKWRDFKPLGSGNLDLKPTVVQYTADAKEFDKQLLMRQYEKRKELENDENDWKSTLWTRYREMANRYALLYACSIAPEPGSTVITIDAVKWGAAFVEWDINNRIKMIEHRYYRSKHEKDCMKVINIMMKWHLDKKTQGKGMPSGKFNVKLGIFTPKERNELIDSLVKQKRLLVIQNTGRGGGYKYYLPQYYGQNGINDDNVGQNDTNNDNIGQNVTIQTNLE